MLLVGITCIMAGSILIITVQYSTVQYGTVPAGMLRYLPPVRTVSRTYTVARIAYCCTV